jgi:hypothetical protein
MTETTQEAKPQSLSQESAADDRPLTHFAAQNKKGRPWPPRLIFYTRYSDGQIFQITPV